MPILYVIATPIGNLEDISYRAVRLLGEVGLIAAEDTRKTKRLLASYNIQTPLVSYHDFSTDTKRSYLLKQLDKIDVALVSEAGMPGISDPGYSLIAECIKQDIRVIPIPGASAVITALVVSGLPTDQFTYIGFLPRKKTARRRLLESIGSQPRTIITFESPHRIQATLQDLADVLGDRQIAICREMTKVHEEIFRGTAQKAIQHFAKPRGEFTLVVEGNKTKGKQADLNPQLEEE